MPDGDRLTFMDARDKSGENTVLVATRLVRMHPNLQVEEAKSSALIGGLSIARGACGWCGIGRYAITWFINLSISENAFALIWRAAPIRPFVLAYSDLLIRLAKTGHEIDA